MTSRAITTARRLSLLPRLVSRMPPVWRVVGGAAVVVAGVLLVTRPLTSLSLFALYIGASAIGSGVLDLASPRTTRWWERTAAILWMLGGLVVLVWLGLGLAFLSDVIAVLLIVGGLASFGEVVRGSVSERVLTGAWGAAQVAFGVFALSWPDVAVLVTAVVFGVRTVVWGVALVVGALVGIRDRGETPDAPEKAKGRSRWIAAGRWAVAVVLVAVIGAGWSITQWLSDGAPVIDSFYATPDEVPSTPGVLLRVGDYAGRQPTGGQVRRILYTTTDAAGRPAIGSGFVIVPDGQGRTLRHAVLWGHGTTGVARGCAPSLADGFATKWAIPGVEEALARGWIIIAPDYPGQGAEGTFPYLIGRGEAHASLDALRAARQADGVHLDGKVAVWGYSQGGHAALWTGALAQRYAPEFRIVGTAALAPAADPLGLAAELTAGEASPELAVLVSWVLVPYAETYPDINFASYVAAGGRAIVREMAERCPSEPGILVSVLAAMGVSEDRPLYTADLTGGALGKRLAQNEAKGPFDHPVFVAWGDDDDVIPPGFQRDLVSQLCAAGERVRWLEYRGTGHQDLVLPMSYLPHALISWTQARFTGDPPVDDCVRRPIRP